ncbi:hypothetical protein [Candidatus Symbiopectobacterium sp. 'North America']|uniref:hypothetical protein n=1 Tax=Candidatus Symbiopectobacterium sp. 'North America' TaxID=2794574 RepID=UPI0018C8DBAB|nr:hypothetical protein [Candidatus Symbiopectobacterium sp. 'North America']
MFFSKLATAVRIYSLKYILVYLVILGVAVPSYAIVGINLCIYESWILAWVGMSFVSFIALRILAILELKILDRLDIQEV